jgi:hypothetical protein
MGAGLMSVILCGLVVILLSALLLRAARREMVPTCMEELLAILDYRHPGWQDMVRTVAFERWLGEQDSVLRSYANSFDVEKASYLLDCYKHDQAAHAMRAAAKYLGPWR